MQLVPLGGAPFPSDRELLEIRAQELMGVPVEMSVSRHRPEPQSHNLPEPSLETATSRWIDGSPNSQL